MSHEIDVPVATLDGMVQYHVEYRFADSDDNDPLVEAFWAEDADHAVAQFRDDDPTSPIIAVYVMIGDNIIVYADYEKDE